MFRKIGDILFGEKEEKKDTPPPHPNEADLEKLYQELLMRNNEYYNEAVALAWFREELDRIGASLEDFRLWYEKRGTEK